MPFASKEKQKEYTKARYQKLMAQNPNYAKEEAAKWRKNNLGQARELESTYRQNNKDKLKVRHSQPNERFSRAKSKAKKANREFTLTLDEFTLFCKQPCHYCNGALGIPSPTGSGLDRIDSSKGYIMGNVVTCCMKCNTLKSNILSYTEMKSAIKLIIEMRKGQTDVQCI